jgi:hypothetical protein
MGHKCIVTLELYRLQMRSLLSHRVAGPPLNTPGKGGPGRRRSQLCARRQPAADTASLAALIIIHNLAVGSIHGPSFSNLVLVPKTISAVWIKMLEVKPQTR